MNTFSSNKFYTKQKKNKNLLLRKENSNSVSTCTTSSLNKASIKTGVYLPTKSSYSETPHFELFSLFQKENNLDDTILEDLLNDQATRVITKLNHAIEVNNNQIIIKGNFFNNNFSFVSSKKKQEKSQEKYTKDKYIEKRIEGVSHKTTKEKMEITNNTSHNISSISKMTSSRASKGTIRPKKNLKFSIATSFPTHPMPSFKPKRDQEDTFKTFRNSTERELILQSISLKNANLKSNITSSNSINIPNLKKNNFSKVQTKQHFKTNSNLIGTKHSEKSFEPKKFHKIAKSISLLK